MDKSHSTNYPTAEEHLQAWEELAQGIASSRASVEKAQTEQPAPESKPGELLILGSGIESIGFSLGDKKLIESADKVLFCVADPATHVWLKQLRPDALDLYVLYGENKVRYTTYMQMTEAQLYWVRQGLKVVVVFYGHPGIFVLSTHRAILLARREGYRAVMKAGVCALDTLCADLGVDPCHPGLQTHEATDALIRQRRIDPSLHVILWQVGLIGELGYRRQGYLNSNFSRFIHWLQEIYGKDYDVIHYIASRYPTLDPLIERYSLEELHRPENQAGITGLSTFYLAPKEVVPTNEQVARELGVLKEGQQLITPTSPLREIGLYGPREMKAFDAFADFSIPGSYSWQPETEASKFLISLYFDPELQRMYRQNPEEALDDPRFEQLSPRERSLLTTRESGAIQVASKGLFQRSTSTEKVIIHLLKNKKATAQLGRKLAGLNRREAKSVLKDWLVENDLNWEWSALTRTIDSINRAQLFPWTGVYLDSQNKRVITLIGNPRRWQKSVLYINDVRIRAFRYQQGVLSWESQPDVPLSGSLRPDAPLNGNRQFIGKTWSDSSLPIHQVNWQAEEIDPQRQRLFSSTQTQGYEDSFFYGFYVLRRSGIGVDHPEKLQLSEGLLEIGSQTVTTFQLEKGRLSWKAQKELPAGEIQFILDPIIGSLEFFGHLIDSQSQEKTSIYGAKKIHEDPSYQGPDIPDWAAEHLRAIAWENLEKGGLFLWHKWEKQHLISQVVNRIIARLS
ncbi:hypothetical protein KFE98_08110 [bacterium SCSIO 12741]|nr:hypothetical protein KFE98_08110 [bacterium SCSIO 12741]